MNGADWLSYSLQDFIMFSPEVLLRLTARANHELWPWLPFLWAVAVSIPFLAISPRERLRRMAVSLVGVSWIICGYVYLVRLYGPINWPATYFGWAFVLQGLAVLLLAATANKTARARPGVALVWIVAVIALPGIAAYEAEDWQAAAFFSLSPEVTASVSLLLLTSLARPWSWLISIIPLLWCVFASLVFWGLGLYLMLVIPVLAVVFLVFSATLNPSPAQSPG